MGGLPSSFHSFEVLVLVGSGGGESQLSSSVGSPHFGSRHRAGESPYWERESPGNACGFQMYLQDPSLLKEGEKKASTTIMDSSVLCAVHTGWVPQTRHSRPARCGVGVCPCTHGNRRPVNCFYLLLGSTTQIHLAGLGVATLMLSVPVSMETTLGFF